jgi:hypothetical protein
MAGVATLSEVGHRVTAASRPHVFWIGENPASQKLVRGWPVGPALLETLGDLNPDVCEALAHERAWLSDQGYSEDLPLPALWWKTEPRPELV